MINEMHNLEGKAIHLCISEGKSNKKKADDRNRILPSSLPLRREQEKAKHKYASGGDCTRRKFVIQAKNSSSISIWKVCMVINWLIPSDIMCLI